MQFLKNFNQFINEGAYLDQEGRVILNAKDDPKNNDEVLKSSSGGVRFFKEVGLAGRKESQLIFPKFFSLSASSYSGTVDHPGRFKYTMDQLKDANIVDIETSLPEFIQYSFRSLGITSNFMPSYLVSVGSTKGLVGEICNAINVALGKNLPIISLPKVEYLNAGEAVNWDEIRAQMKRQASKENPEGIKTLNIAKNNLLHYIDKDATNPGLIIAIRRATSVEELERLVTGKRRYISPESEVKWHASIEGEEMTPFKVRSSGRNAGGTREFWLRKYKFEEEKFLKAVIDCAKSVSIDPNRPKKMLIVDDNINTGQDMRNIKDNIKDVINGIYEDSKDYVIKNRVERQFGFYVLYDMKPDSSFSYTDGRTGNKLNKYPVKKEEIDAFAELKKLPKI